MKSVTENDAEFDVIKASFLNESEDDRVSSIIGGLGHEDDFALLCRSMGTCTELSPINQSSVVKNSESVTPDFLAAFELAQRWGDLPEVSPLKDRIYRCFIEVKGVRKNKWKISKKDYRRRLNYAKRLELPLVFAIKFTRLNLGFWLLLEARTIRELDRKVKPVHLKLGVGHLLFGDYLIVPRLGLKLLATFEQEGPMRISQFGCLKELRLLLPEGTQYQVASTNAAFVFLVLGCLWQTRKDVSSDNGLTTVCWQIDQQARFLSDIITSLNYLPVGDDGRPIDKGRIIARLDSPDGTHLVSREKIESVFHRFEGAFQFSDVDGSDGVTRKCLNLFAN